MIKQELFSILHTFKKDRNPGPDGWLVELYLYFIKPLGEDLLGVVEVRISDRISGSFNATFHSFDSRIDCPKSFAGFRPISLSNCICKIISKAIDVRMNPILSTYISAK